MYKKTENLMKNYSRALDLTTKWTKCAIKTIKMKITVVLFFGTFAALCVSNKITKFNFDNIAIATSKYIY